MKRVNNLIKNSRARLAAIVVVIVALASAVTVGVAQATNAAGSGRWVTATAATGDVTQTFTTSGTVTRQNTSAAAFAASGTVNSVKVAVGSKVTAGSVLATIDTRALKLAVLEAQTSVAQAELNLDNARSGTSTSGTSAGGRTSSASSVNVATLNQLVGTLNTALTNQTKTCDPIMAWLLADKTASSASPTPTPSPSIGTEPTVDDLAACAAARTQVTAANQALQRYLVSANKASTADASTGSGSGGSSASQVASAKSALLQAQQKLATAQDSLADASLLAPISGTVGAVGFAVGDSSSSGTITIVGSGNATVTIEVPLKTRGSLATGATAKVTPAGSLTALSGTVTNINLLETSGTSGDSTTYTTTVAVSDPTSLLASGAKASVSIPVKSAVAVVRIPASAVTPTATGQGTVQVLASGAQSPTSVSVKTGAVGGGYVQITSGLNAGQVVVLADREAAIPTNSSSQKRSSSSSRTSSSSSGSAAQSTAANR